MIHVLKTWPGPFEAVRAQKKPYEVRKFDRPFSVGDTLLLREWDPLRGDGTPGSGAYTGRFVFRTVTYLTRPGGWGLPADIGVMGLGLLSADGERDAAFEFIRRGP